MAFPVGAFIQQLVQLFKISFPVHSFRNTFYSLVRKESNMKMMGKMTFIFLFIGSLGLINPYSATAHLQHNCDKTLLQPVLDRLRTLPETIIVTGTCDENLVIKKDDVTIQGGTYLPFDPTQSTISVQGARRVLITGVTVIGGRNGIVVSQGGSLTVEGNSNISGATQIGVAAVYGSSVTVNSSTIQGNLYGVMASDNSALVLSNSTVTNNTGSGVLSIRSSSARIGQNPLGASGPNTITNNGSSDVSISRSAHAIIDGNTIESNSHDGIHIEGSSAVVTNNSINNNGSRGIIVYSAGNARIGITDTSGYGGNIVNNNNLGGIQIESGSNAFLLGNEVKNNGLTTGRSGIGIYRGTCHSIGDNLIANNGGYGIGISAGSLFQGVGDWGLTPGPDTIQENALSGILATMKSVADVRKALITGNLGHGVWISTQSTMRIYNSTISNNTEGIRLDTGSGISFWHPSSESTVTVTNNSSWGLNCFGDESSYGGSADPPNISGNGSGGAENINSSCTGF
jgi:parallel beta-helix repeat protein